jgi:hypothetical protein
MDQYSILLIIAAIALIFGAMEFGIWYGGTKNNSQVLSKILEIIKEDVVDTIARTMDFLKGSISKYDTYASFEEAVKGAAISEVKSIIYEKYPQCISFIDDIILKRFIDMIIETNPIELSLKKYYESHVIESELTDVEFDNDETENGSSESDQIETTDITQELNKVYNEE